MPRQGSTHPYDGRSAEPPYQTPASSLEVERLAYDHHSLAECVHGLLGRVLILEARVLHLETRILDLECERLCDDASRSRSSTDSAPQPGSPCSPSSG